MGLHEVKQFAAMQLEILRQKRGDIDDEISELERFLGIAQEQRPSHAEGTYTAGITAAIYDLLVAVRPRHRQDILEKLEAQEFYVSGKDKLGTVSAYLSTDQRFASLGKGQWTLTDEPSKIVQPVQPVQPVQVVTDGHHIRLEPLPIEAEHDLLMSAVIEQSLGQEVKINPSG